MEKQMVQCEDGRRRQARIHGIPKEEGNFRIWKAGVRLKGKHVTGEAWYSHQTKTWYFITDPDGKHSHLMDRISDTLRREKINKLQDRLRQLKSRQAIEEKKIAEHRKNFEAIESEMAAVSDQIAKLEKGVPLESGQSLQSSLSIKKS